MASYVASGPKNWAIGTYRPLNYGVVSIVPDIGADLAYRFFPQLSVYSCQEAEDWLPQPPVDGHLGLPSFFQGSGDFTAEATPWSFLRI